MGVLFETMGKIAPYFQLKKIERKIKHKEGNVPMEILEELHVSKIPNLSSLLRKANTGLVSYILSRRCHMQRLGIYRSQHALHSSESQHKKCPRRESQVTVDRTS